MLRNRRYAISPKVAVLSSASVILFVLGLLLGNDLVFASVPILIYVVLSFWMKESPQIDLDVTRNVERAQLYESDEVKVRLRVRNSGSGAIPFLMVEDEVPKDFRSDTGNFPTFTFRLEAGETRDLYYALKARKFGVFSIGPAILKTEDSFGFGRVAIKKEITTPIVVLPKMTERLQHFKIAPRKTKPWPGEIVAKNVGIGMDNYSIRQYIPGDSLRKINWRASAKFDDDELLLMNEQTAELGADTIVIVDARPVSNIVSPTGESIISNSIRAAISITDKLLRDRNRVGLVTIGIETERIAPGYGRRQYNRLILSLIRVRAGGFFTFENVPSYLRFFYPHLAQVVLISPLIDSEGLGAAAEISRLGYELLVVSPNPIDYTSASSAGRRNLIWKRGAKEEEARSFEISLKLSELTRKSNLAQLQGANIFVLDWRKDEPLDYSLSKNLRVFARQTELIGKKPTS